MGLIHLLDDVFREVAVAEFAYAFEQKLLLIGQAKVHEGPPSERLLSPGFFSRLLPEQRIRCEISCVDGQKFNSV